MEDKLLYAQQWDASSEYFYEKSYYSWMTDKIKEFSAVLEIGCGTGYGTLSLAEKGFTVIALDKNIECIEKAEVLLKSKGFMDKVQFVHGDIAEDSFREMLVKTYRFDVVICWNIGTYWNAEMMQYYLPFMLEYGLNVLQIKDNPESSYSELIIWESCRLAKAKGVAMHIIDRGTEIITLENDPYYYSLKNEFNFSNIGYDNLKADSVSSGGRMLSTNGVPNDCKKIDIVFVSILFT